ncbi:MAG: hopanoid biosynthesis-associated protein HpnK [Caulobacteraceae bacterium]
MIASQRTAPSPPKGLIITADDFGAAIEVNEAVELGFSRGVLTAASLMVGAPAATDAVARAKLLPGLGVGLHLVLTDGRPILPPREVPRLVNAEGRFRDDMVAASFAMFFSLAARRELAAEIAAQFAAFAATGLALDHVNAHKHFHLHPTIAGLILKVGAAHGLAAARLPVEPAKVLREAEAGAAPASPLAELWSRLGRVRFRHAGILVPDQVFGLAWSGALSEHRLTALLERLPAGLSEIYLHPAASDAFAGGARGYRYADELAALLSAKVRRAAAASGARRGAFRDFLAGTL